MSLSEAYAAIDNPSHSQCKTCRWYLQLDPEDQAFFDQKADESLRTREWAKLFKACTTSGLEIVVSSLRHHCHNHHSKIRITEPTVWGGQE